MSEFKLSARSLKNISRINCDLAAVVTRAIKITEVDFAVIQGRRLLEEQYALYGKGRRSEDLRKIKVPEFYARPNERKVTWVIRSKHVLGEAVDVAPYVDGKLDWDESGKKGLWPKIASAFAQAAEEYERDTGNKADIEWGGSWKSPKTDRPHFQINID